MSDLVKEIRDNGKNGWCGHCEQAADEIERIKRALEQIAIVCTDNMDRSCDHRMALEFVRQIANDALPSDQCGGSDA